MAKQTVDERRRKLEVLCNDPDPEVAMKAMDMLNKMDGAYKAEVDTRPVLLLANFKLDDNGRYTMDGEPNQVTDFSTLNVETNTDTE